MKQNVRKDVSCVHQAEWKNTRCELANVFDQNLDFFAMSTFAPCNTIAMNAFCDQDIEEILAPAIISSVKLFAWVAQKVPKIKDVTAKISS